MFEVAFIPLFSQAVLYGLYLPTFVHSLRWLLFDDEGLDVRKKISWQMLSITIIFFLFMTAVIGIQLQLTLGPAQLHTNPRAYNKLDITTVCIFSDVVYKLLFG